MTHRGGLIELFVVLFFLSLWGILEWVTLRKDRRRPTSADESAGDAGHPKG